MKITHAVYVKSSADHTQCPSPDKAEFAFIGRSNVGKSSLINFLCNQKNLAKTSSEPGKTQLINHFLITANEGKKQNAQWFLVDLPGYGYAKVSVSARNRWEQMIENYLRKRENLVNVFVLIDSRHPLQEIDLGFVNKLGVWGIPFSIVFTKSDKEKPSIVEKNTKGFLDAMREDWEFLPPSFITSAEKKIGKEPLMAYIQECNEKAREDGIGNIKDPS